MVADVVRFSFRASFSIWEPCAAIDKALSRLATDGTIRRLARGVYDYPKTHPQIGLLSPAPDAIAKAIAGRDQTISEEAAIIAKETRPNMGNSNETKVISISIRSHRFRCNLHRSHGVLRIYQGNARHENRTQGAFWNDLQYQLIGRSSEKNRIHGRTGASRRELTACSKRYTITHAIVFELGAARRHKRSVALLDLDQLPDQPSNDNASKFATGSPTLPPQTQTTDQRGLTGLTRLILSLIP